MSLASNLNQTEQTLTALLEYANGVTGASDVSVGDAIHTLADGYGQGGGGIELKEFTVTTPCTKGNNILAMIPNYTSSKKYAYWLKSTVGAKIDYQLITGVTDGAGHGAFTRYRTTGSYTSQAYSSSYDVKCTAGDVYTYIEL